MKFVPIYDALVIKALKNSPPHIAFEELIESEKSASEWNRLEKLSPQTLAAEKSLVPLYTQRVELPEMVFKKEVEVVFAKAENRVDVSPSLRLPANVASQSERQNPQAYEWMDQLPKSQARRLEQANKVLSEDWSLPTWRDMARKVVDDTNRKLDQEASNSRVYVASASAGNSGSGGAPLTQVPRGKVSVPNNDERDSRDELVGLLPSDDDRLPVGQKNIVGPIEITGGLAVTNEHHLEIRRNDEGILKELGSVDLRKGTYNITVEDANGSIRARLVNKEGKTLGEGSFRLNRIASNISGPIQGPKLKVAPHPDYAGVITNIYSTSAEDAAPKNTRATFIKGVSEVVAKKDGAVAMDNVARGSSTVMRGAAPSFMQTASIVMSGKEFRSQLYPESMINALIDLVEQERGQELTGEPAVIWGRVTKDDKNVAGVEVALESDPSLQAIYFNQFMIPDFNLKATSENGLYAFVDAESGFHSLIAIKGNELLGYQNVVVEDGSVAQGDIESTSHYETIPLRVFDAFSGNPQLAKVTLQSLEKELFTDRPAMTVNLPQVERLGLMRVQPEGADYISAIYLYSDKDTFIHAPLLQWSWLSNIKSYLKIEDRPNTGVIVGFVPDENFEVYLAAVDNLDARYIVYFDMQGRILQNQKGIAGGGFIIYNTPVDTHEVVVLGARTQKIYSRVLPVDENSLSVLSFRD